jgi:hypothetical protein
MDHAGVPPVGWSMRFRRRKAREGREAVLFCKKEPKNFYPLQASRSVSPTRSKRIEVFLLLFLQKKKILS